METLTKARTNESYDRLSDLARMIAALSHDDQMRLGERVQRLAGADRDHRFDNQTSPQGASAGTAAAPREYPQLRASEELSLGNIEDAMRYQPWDNEQTDRGDQVREALTHAAKVILRTVPRCAFRSACLRKVVEARMDANAAISFRGRF